MNTYCPSCGSKNEWSGVKPVKCEICNEPFVRKVAASSSQARRQTDARDTNQQRFQDGDEDIPVSFDVITDAPAKNARGRRPAPVFEKIASIGEDGKMMVVGAGGQQSIGSFQRDVLPPELSKAKQEALKHMIPGGGAK